jgi:hypothetical protein
VDMVPGSEHSINQDKLRVILHAALEKEFWKYTKNPFMAHAIGKLHAMSAVHASKNISVDPTSEEYSKQKDFGLYFGVLFTDRYALLGTEDDEGNFHAGASPYETIHNKFAVVTMASPEEFDVEEEFQHSTRFASRPAFTIRSCTRAAPPVPAALANFCRNVNTAGNGKAHGGVCHAFPNHAYFHGVDTAHDAANFLHAIASHFVQAEVKVMPHYNENFFVWLKLTLPAEGAVPQCSLGITAKKAGTGTATAGACERKPTPRRTRETRPRKTQARAPTPASDALW